MTDKLLPCPFCTISMARFSQNFVHPASDCIISLIGIPYERVDAWNTRAGSDISDKMAEALERWVNTSDMDFQGCLDQTNEALAAYRKGKE